MIKNFKEFLNEGKGEDLAKSLIEKARAKMKNLSDDEVEEFRQMIALAFDLKMNESVDEAAQYRMNRHTYDMINMRGDNGEIRVKAGEDGILGHRDTHISWDNIRKLQKQYRK